MNSKYSVLIGAASAALFLGCGQGNERLVEKAAIEGAVNARAQVDSANENLARKSHEMESDLAARHRFYQGLKGAYEGVMQTEGGEFKVRITLAPSLNPYPVERVRTLEEITADLNSLYLNVQVVQWNPANRLSAVGCRIEQVRPDLLTGEITIAAESCPNLYVLRIDGDKSLASDLRGGRAAQVSALRGEVYPTSNAAVYTFTAARAAARKE